MPTTPSTGVSVRRAARGHPFVYIVDLNERGVFRAHVVDPFQRSVFSVDTEEDPSWFEDGWMKNTRDMTGLHRYLIQAGIMRPEDGLYCTAQGALESCDPEDVVQDIRVCKFGNGEAVYEQPDGCWRLANGGYVWPDEKTLRSELGNGGNFSIFDLGAEDRDSEEAHREAQMQDPGGLQDDWEDSHHLHLAQEILARAKVRGNIQIPHQFTQFYAYARQFFPSLSSNDLIDVAEIAAELWLADIESSRSAQRDPGGLQDDWIERWYAERAQDAVRVALARGWRSRNMDDPDRTFTWIVTLRNPKETTATRSEIVRQAKYQWFNHPAHYGNRHQGQAMHETPGMDNKEEGEVPKSLQPAPNVCRIPLSIKDLRRDSTRRFPKGLSITS